MKTKANLDDVLKLAKEYIEKQDMKYMEALEKAKKELEYENRFD